MQTEVFGASKVEPSKGSMSYGAEPAQDPNKIREAIALLVAQDQIDTAAEMADLALVLFPSSEPVLAISALVAEVQQNWFEAYQILCRLQEIQGDNTQPTTLQHRIRVLRCMGAIEEAKGLCDQALTQFPEDSSLLDERRALEAVAA
jgi:tetratricopeptide (TPR) repeat protein